MATKTLDEILKARILKLNKIIEQLSKIDDKDVQEAATRLISYRDRLVGLFEKEGIAV